jgi:hypothetical protein
MRTVIFFAPLAILLMAPSGALGEPERAVPPEPKGPTSQPADANRPGAASQPSQPNEGRPDWEPKLRATVKPASAHVGDPIEVTITVEHRPDISVTLPVQLELGKFRELSRDSARRVEGPEGHLPTVEQSYTVRVAAYELGELTLPPIELTALGPDDELITIATTAFPIKIVSVLANEPDPKLKQAETPIRVYRRTWWLLYTIGGLAMLGIIVLTTILLYRRVQARREASKPPPPPIPAHVIAFERLDQLDVETLIAAEAYKELYLQLSEILREYIGRLWHFEALEMTSAEIGAVLAEREVDADARGRLKEMFSSWDLVKFAKYRPDGASARAAVDETRRFIEQTRTRGTEPTTTAQGATAAKAPTTAQGATAAAAPTTAQGATAAAAPTPAQGATSSKSDEESPR